MAPIRLTMQQARRFILDYHGLRSSYVWERKKGVLDYIRRVGCIQFDPLNIVGNNPELVLQARVADFRPQMLRALLYEDRQLLEGWDKNTSIYGVGDWPYFRRFRDYAMKRFGDSERPATKILPRVREEIEARGPLSSLDLDFEQSVDWSWAPTRIARAALESMYFWGELVIHHRVNTRKVYDFAHRHLPVSLLSAADPNPMDEMYHDWYVHRRVGSVGLLWNKAESAWLGMMGIKSGERTAAIERLLAVGKLVEVGVDGFESMLYVCQEDLALLETARAARDRSRRAVILAPLDNLLWDRRLIQALFNFYYVWEVYKPVKERRYGYYVLPILYGDRFIARFEPLRAKEDGALVIKNWWWEDDVSISNQMKTALGRCFRSFLNFLDTDRLAFDPQMENRDDLDWLRAIAG